MHRDGLLDSLPFGCLGTPAPDGDVAQLGEHRVRIAGVRGSSPLISTITSCNGEIVEMAHYVARSRKVTRVTTSRVWHVGRSGRW